MDLVSLLPAVLLLVVISIIGVCSCPLEEHPLHVQNEIQGPGLDSLDKDLAEEESPSCSEELEPPPYVDVVCENG